MCLLKNTLLSCTVLMLILLTFCACGQSGDKDNKKTSSPCTIRILGAWTLYPMMIRWADEYQKTHSGCQIDIAAGGASAGYALIYGDDQTLSDGGFPAVTIGGGSAGVFAYQLMAGFDVDVTKNIIVSVAYKYIAPQKISFDTVIDNSPPGLLTQDVTFKFPAITLGISYLF